MLVCMNPGERGMVPKGKRTGGDEGQYSAHIKENYSETVRSLTRAETDTEERDFPG